MGGVEGSAQFAHPDWARTTDLFYSSLDQLIRSRLLLYIDDQLQINYWPSDLHTYQGIVTGGDL